MGKPRIGIVAQESYGIVGVALSYIQWASKFGTPVLLTPDSPVNVDALLLPGGADVYYKRYALIRGYWTQDPNSYLEKFDEEVLPGLIGKLPIFGICRGLQTLNVILGGTLTQHLFRHPYSLSEKDMVHTVTTSDGRTLGKVNSFHHQCIKKLGGGVTAELFAHDGTVEAISCKSKGIFAVQWHPERLGDPYSVDKFNQLLGIK